MKNFRIIPAIPLLFIAFAFCISQASATQLPQPIAAFLKSKFPGVEIRFDGLIELPDKTIYLPVLPLMYGNAKNPAAVAQTIPAKTDFSKKPDMILFANNLALFKIIQQKNGELTVNYSPAIPLNVKLGILPQDLIVPHGLILPTELRVILGDLKVRIKAKKDEDDLVFYGNPSEYNEIKAGLLTGKTELKQIKSLPELDFLKNKALYSSSFRENTVDIIDSQTGRTKKTMKLPSFPSNMVLTPDERYLLISLMSINKVLVVDTFSELFLKEIEVGKMPASILMSHGLNKAYIANKLSSSISEIDLDNMIVKKEIPVLGTPDNLVFTENKQNIIYIDTTSGNIYSLNLEKELCTKILQINNVSKFALNRNCLYILSRSDNEIIIYDYASKTESARVKVGQKPVDLQIYEKRNEIYVLSAGSDEINIIDMIDFKVKKDIKLDTGGFPSKITLIQKENKALITNHDTYQIVVYDIKKENIPGFIPVSKTINFLQVSR